MPKDEQKVTSASSKEDEQPTRSCIARRLRKGESANFLRLLGSVGLNKEWFCRKLVELCRPPLTVKKLECAKRQIQHVFVSRRRKLNAPLAAECAKTLDIGIYELNKHLCVKPQLTSTTAIRHNLPEAPERFFGYKTLRRKVTAKLAAKGLTVLHEIGGTGKTTFAKQAARDALQRKILPGGAVWINCETGPTFDDCLKKIGVILMGDEAAAWPIESCEPSLMKYFARHHTLLVFDNLETVIANRESSSHFSRFIVDCGRTAAVLVTTTKIHDGLKKNVLPFPALDPKGAKEMFIYEAGSTQFSPEDKAVIQNLCLAVGYLPLGILLLARQAAKTTLAHLAKELDKSIAVMATDDRTLKSRHWSMTDCFQVSFSLLSGEDKDTLFRLCVPSHGLGTKCVSEYLDKTNWLTSLNNCLNAVAGQVKTSH